VQAVLLDESGAIKTATVIVPDRQLSLAIGKEGQNARLAAKLTGWRIDIKSDSEARTEGLDRVIADRAQEAAIKATEDLLAKAERILRSESDEVEDRLFQAAQALRSGETVEAPEILPGEFKSFEELLAEVSDGDQPKHFGESAFIAEEMGGGVPLPQAGAPEWPTILSEETILPSEAAFSELESGPVVATTPSTPAESLLADAGQEQLPEVITADMLRARMAERKKFAFSEEDIEVPAELLAGYEEEETEDDIFDASGKGKGKGKGKGGKGKPAPKAKSKKAAPKRGWGFEEDEF
jgi:N utilization substance protein A